MINENKQRLYYFDFLKGICIIFVIITHCNWQDTERLKFFFPFWIDMAVPIFMVISGYMYAMSYKRSNINSIGNAYLLKNILNKVFRFTIPFIFIFLVEQILYIISEGYINRSIWEVCCLFLNGETGPGSYYYPVMIQFIFVYPFIYFIIKKYDLKGLLICGILNATFEVLKSAYCMNEECYRLLMFRYIFIIAYGCYLEIGKTNIKSIWYLISFIVGILFIIIVSYTKYTPIIIIFWTRTSFIAGLYIFPVIKVLINIIKFRCKILEILGKASFDIFLVQKVYFAYILKWISFSAYNKFPQIVLNVIICIIGGIIFYYIDEIILHNILKKYNFF